MWISSESSNPYVPFIQNIGSYSWACKAEEQHTWICTSCIERWISVFVSTVPLFWLSALRGFGRCVACVTTLPLFNETSVEHFYHIKKSPPCLPPNTLCNWTQTCLIIMCRWNSKYRFLIQTPTQMQPQTPTFVSQMTIKRKMLITGEHIIT